MCIGRPEEVKGARFLCGAPVIARVALVDNIGEIIDKDISPHYNTNNRSLCLFPQSDGCMSGKLKCESKTPTFVNDLLSYL